MNFCPNCGKEVKDSDKFCGNCGNNLTDSTKKTDDTDPKKIDTTKRNAHVKQNQQKIISNPDLHTQEKDEINKKDSQEVPNPIEGQNIIICKNCGSNAIELNKQNTGFIGSFLSLIIGGYLFIVFISMFLSLSIVVQIILLVIWIVLIIIWIAAFITGLGKYKSTCKKCGFETTHIDKQLAEKYFKEVYK